MPWVLAICALHRARAASVAIVAVDLTVHSCELQVLCGEPECISIEMSCDECSVSALPMRSLRVWVALTHAKFTIV